jgi:hypothetical protein
MGGFFQKRSKNKTGNTLNFFDLEMLVYLAIFYDVPVPVPILDNLVFSTEMYSRR